MELDARTLPPDAELHADICIVGAGPAGITLARELVGSDLDVVVLDSGGLKVDRRVQRLNDGDVIGDRYTGLRETRHRRVGGTAHLWNTPIGHQRAAKYVPLDPRDFTQRENFPLSGWPFDYAHLAPFYERSQAVCGLGPLAYEGEDWDAGKREALTPEPPLSTKVYQLGLGSLFTQTYVDELCQSDNVRLYHHVTAYGLVTGPQRDTVVAAQLACMTGGHFRLRAKYFVLAAGTIENARLLLNSGRHAEDALGNRHGWVGRCLMEHPRDYSLTLIPHVPIPLDDVSFYDTHLATGGTMICGRWGLGEQTALTRRLPNASITFMPKLTHSRPGLPGRLWKRILGVVGSQQPSNGYGWSRRTSSPKAIDAWQLLMNIEQRPNPQNRIALSKKLDPLKTPRAEMHWRWTDEEQAQLEQLRSLVASTLEASGIGKVITGAKHRPDPNAHHHAGTTRMSVDPRYGVVDANLRVHETRNLFVAGASIFPTAGFANPTLSIVALSLRLADHLKRVVPRSV